MMARTPRPSRKRRSEFRSWPSSWKEKRNRWEKSSAAAGLEKPPVVAGSPDPATPPDRRSPGASGDLRSGEVARSGDRATTAVPSSGKQRGRELGKAHGRVDPSRMPLLLAI